MADRYRIASAANRASMEKVSISQLDKDVPYIIMKMVHSVHPEFKETIKVVLRDSNKELKFTNLPPRFAKNLNSTHVAGFMENIASKRPPFLIFRGCIGKSFDIDMVPFDMDIARKALKGLPHKRAEDEGESTLNDSLSWLEEAVEGK